MTDPGYRVRPFQSGDEQGILDLFNKVFGEDDPDFTPRTMEQWQWEFEANPAGKQIMVAETDAGDIIAHYACLTARANLAGETVLTGQGIDSMVHPDWRRGLKRQGPFLTTARAYFDTWGNERVCGFGYGFPNTKAIRIGVRLIGYVPVAPELPVLYRNYHENPDDNEMGGDLDAAGEVREVARFGADLDELWARLAPSYPVALIRDSTYWNWRYADCAYAPYRLFEIRDGNRLRGAFVTRAHWQGVPIQALSDYLADPTDDSALATALRRTVACGREAEQARVEIWFPGGSPLFQRTLELGFKTEASRVALCLMLYRKDVEFDWFTRHWYYTIGDCDVF